MARKKPDASAEPEPDTTAPEWEPGPGEIVSDGREYHIRVNGQRYVHVSEAPDGRWVYRAD